MSAIKLIQAMKNTAREALVEAAKERGTLRFRTGYADGFWAVTVYADGSTTYGGYAAENRNKEIGDIDELSLWEIVSLVEAFESSPAT